MRRAVLAAVFLAAAVGPTAGLPAGDTSVTGLAGLSGRFYIFADKVFIAGQTIQIASSVEVIHKIDNVKNITTDQDGNALVNPDTNSSRIWGSATYLPVTSRSNTTGFIFVNEGDTYTEDDDTPYSCVTIIDAGISKILARHRLGARLSKIYAFNKTSSVWTHSDADGMFYVMTLDNSTYNVSITNVTAQVSKTGYGELTYDEDLHPYAYGTNVAEQIIFKYRVSNATLAKAFSYGSSLKNASACEGLRSAFYAKANKHVFMECADKSGVLEWDTELDRIVTLHANIVGTISGPPSGDRIFVTNYDNSSATILATRENGIPSKLQADTILAIPSQPGTPVYHYNTSTGEKPQNFTGYRVLWPTARNTNLNNIAAAGEEVTSPAYAAKPSDCQYSETPTSDGSFPLAIGGNGIMTPQCGSCAPGVSNNTVASLFNSSLAGFETVNFENSSKSAVDFISAGAVLPKPSLASDANACSFATARRHAVVGGALVATVADLPKPSVFFYDADRDNGPYNLTTAQNPVQLVFVPVRADNVSEIFASLRN